MALGEGFPQDVLAAEQAGVLPAYQDGMASRLWYGALQQAFAIDPRHPALLSPPPRLPFTPSPATSPVVLSSCNGTSFDHFGPKDVAGKHALRRYQSVSDVEISLAADGCPSFVRTAPAVAAQ